MLVAGVADVGRLGSIQHPPEPKRPDAVSRPHDRRCPSRGGEGALEGGGLRQCGRGAVAVPGGPPEHLVEHGTGQHLAVMCHGHRLAAHQCGTVDHRRGSAQGHEGRGEDHRDHGHGDRPPARRARCGPPGSAPWRGRPATWRRPPVAMARSQYHGRKKTTVTSTTRALTVMSRRSTRTLDSRLRPRPSRTSSHTIPPAITTARRATPPRTCSLIGARSQWPTHRSQCSVGGARRPRCARPCRRHCRRSGRICPAEGHVRSGSDGLGPRPGRHSRGTIVDHLGCWTYHPMNRTQCLIPWRCRPE